jgi:hypothetical protein
LTPFDRYEVYLPSCEIGCISISFIHKKIWVQEKAALFMGDGPYFLKWRSLKHATSTFAIYDQVLEYFLTG